MKKNHFILSPLLAALMGFIFLANSGGTAANGNGDSTGSPGSNNTCGNCHNGGAFGVSISAVVKDHFGNTVTSYLPGEIYTITYQVSATTGSPSFGFQGVALSAGNVNAGFFDSALTVNTQISSFGSRLLPEHSSRSTTGNFTVRWIAPLGGTGDVTFYYMGNAVNNSNSTSGDQATPTQTLVLNETPVFRVTITQTSSIVCHSDSNASLSAHVFAGVAPYQYFWSNGINSGITGSPLHQIMNIPAGNYSITVMDAVNNIAISSVQITEPDSIKTTFNILDPKCYTASNGSINSLTIGGILPYQKTWNTGSTSGNLTQIDTGNYQLTIIDALGCIVTDSVQIDSPNITPYIEPNPDTVFCTTGWTVIYDAGNLISGYDYLWSTGDTTYSISITEFGDYWLQVTDSINCQGFDTAYIDFCFSVSENTSVQESFKSFPNPTNETLFIESTERGEIQILSSQGKLAIRTEIEKGESSIQIKNLPAGIYLLIFTNAEKSVTKRIIIN